MREAKTKGEGQTPYGPGVAPGDRRNYVYDNTIDNPEAPII